LASEPAEDFEILPGEGVKVRLGKEEVVVGNSRVFGRFHGGEEGGNAALAAIGPLANESKAWEMAGGTVCWVFVNGRAVGVFNANDVTRPEAKEAIDMLRKMGIKTIMLTGDNDGAAAAVQKIVGVSERRSKLLPHQKTDEVKLLKFGCLDKGESTQKTVVVGMVGDGVNDAPALALADVGLAMGVTGTVVAMETADVALMDNDLRKIAEVIALGRASVSKIRQNVILSVLSKLVVLALAFSGYAYLWLAIVADVGTMLAVTLNGLSLLKREPKKPKTEGHGHSHGGKACHGHGEPKPAASHNHGHSHGDKPCHGHGEPKPVASHNHGHSHGDKPCHGHGEPKPVASHGHGHGHGHGEPKPAATISPLQGHGHSHGDKPCHGHGHGDHV